jgi:hypothetical protein
MKLSVRGLWICLWPLFVGLCGGATNIDRVNCASLACKGDIPKMCVCARLICVDVCMCVCMLVLGFFCKCALVIARV